MVGFFRSYDIERTLTILLLIVTAWFPGVSWALTVTAQIDKNPVMMDEAITLTVTVDEDVDRNAFDSSPLLADFVVGNTSVSSQTQIINFNTTRLTTFRTILFPKQTGSFTIPAFTINGATSRPISVTVVDTNAGANAEQRDYFLTAEVSSQTAYVQQHLTYTLKLHVAGNVDSGSLQAPVLDDATIEQLGDDKQYSDIINGKRFQIIERTFVVIPQRSGEFVMQPAIFSGEVIAPGRRQSFGFFNRTRTVTRRGPTLNLKVLPIPSQVKGFWLPSEYVQLSESWSQEDFQVGEPITRTLTLTVAGQKEGQLPSFDPLYPPAMKVYPNQPQLSSAQRNNQIVAQRVETSAIIPSKEGAIVLPGVEIEWFNLQTNEIEVASIPPRQITVLPAPSAQMDRSAPQMSSMPEPASNESHSSSSPTSQDNALWIYTSAVFAVLWLITLGIVIKLLRNQSVANSVPKAEPHKKPNFLSETIKKGSVTEINQALCDWLNLTQGTNIDHLSHLSGQPGYSTLYQAFQDVVASQYGGATLQNGRTALLQAFVSIEKASQTKRPKNSTLPTLNPV